MSNYVASIDFGSSKIAVAVGRKKDGGVTIVSYHDAEAVGINNGEIIKDRQVIDTVKSLIQRASEEIKEDITEVTVGLSGKVLHSETVSTKRLRSNPDSYIDEGELADITKGRYNTKVAEGEVVFEAIPQSYNLDEYLGRTHDDLLGMKGKEIEASYCLIYGKGSILSRRVDILEACGLKMTKAILAPIASARAVLTSQEMENGAALIDIGKGTTEIAIVKDNTVRAVYTIPFAGDAITKDIKNVANITAKWAEDIKLSHGCSCADFTPENKKLVLKSAEGNIDGEMEFQTLSEIIEARLSEILEAARYLIEQSGYADKLAGGVVLTGGTAYMEFIQQLAKALLGQKVRLAAPRSSITIESHIDAFDAYASTAVGLVLETADPMLSHACNTDMQRINANNDNGKPELDMFGGLSGGQEDDSQDDGSDFEPEQEDDRDRRERERREREERREQDRIEKEARRQREREEKARKEAEKRARKEEERKAREGGKKEPGLFDKIFGSTNDNA